MLEIVSADRSMPSVETRWYWISRIVIPPAYKLMIISSSPSIRRTPLGTSTGLNVPCRSRGTVSGTSPTCVPNVLGVNPFLEFADPRPAGSPFSYPR
jgi:hypothetical protein